MSYYKAGTINVANGSATVAGFGTLFLAYVKVGDTLNQGGSSGVVKTVNTDAALTLENPWGGATVSGTASYTINHTGSGWHSTVTFNERINTLLTSFEAHPSATNNPHAVTLLQAIVAQGLTPAVDRVAYLSSASAMALMAFTPYARTLADDVDAAAARATLLLGTAAVLNTGTTGGTIPRNDTANVFSQPLTVQTGALKPLSLESTSASGNFAPEFELYHNYSGGTASPIGMMSIAGPNSAGTKTTYVQWFASSQVTTAGAEDARMWYQTRRGGVHAARFYVGAGLYTPSAGGGDKGTDTINAGGVYDDNVLLTCMALEFLETGTVDTAEWDDRVPDRVTEEFVERVPVMVDVPVEGERLERKADRYVVVKETRIEQRQKMQLVPVKHANGKPVRKPNAAGELADVMVEEPVFEEVRHPAKIEKRRHELAHRFKAMVEDGFDPRDPKAYIAKMRADRALPGMPTIADWRHNELNLGEIHNRLWLATEMLALAFVGLEERVTALEARAAA